MSDKPTNYHLAEAVETIAVSTTKHKYTPEIKFLVVSSFFVTNSSKKASEMTGVPASTIREWKNNSEWWAETLVLVKKAKNAELDGKLTKMMGDLTKGISTRLVEGDLKLNKYGELTAVPVSAKDQSAIMKVISDLRDKLRGEGAKGNSAEEGNIQALEDRLINAVKSAKQEESIPGEVVVHGIESSNERKN